MNIRPLTALAFLLLSTCLTLSPAAQAVDPPPDGGYANGNTAEGEDALFSLTTGIFNTAIGFQALYNSTDAGQNTGIGHLALFSNTRGFANTAVGSSALYNNTIGQFNTAIGLAALLQNTTGNDNTATGASALSINSTGSANVADGAAALNGNTTGSFNTAVGDSALFYNLTGSHNTAIGYQAMAGKIIAQGGSNNTANGWAALYQNTIGSFNVAIGGAALRNNTEGSNNIALGRQAGINLTTGNNNIDIGNTGLEGEADTIRVGKQGTQMATYIAGISGVTVAGGVTVVVDSTGHLGVATSSARYKDKIKPMDKASEAILALEPVIFRYKHDLDPDSIPQFGLVAEQVEKINPALVTRDEQGKPYTVRYEAVNAMLLNEFLKEHLKVQALEATVSQQQSTNLEQEKEIKALAAAVKEQAGQIREVTDQLALSKSAPQIVANN